MKITIEVPAELADLIKEAVEGGDYVSAEQIALDGLWLWADAVETGAYDDEEAGPAADEDLLLAMERRGRERG
jgi:Arc/MetJ-type ribon-helix-helix transcriptional regulator